MHNFLRPLLALILFVAFASNANAQGILGRSFGTLDADAISKYDYEQLKSKMAKTGKDEAVFLKWLQENQRYNLRQQSRSGVRSIETLDSLQGLPFVNKNIFRDTVVFGSDLFSPYSKLDFAPNLQMAYNPRYVVGPGDELELSIFGVQTGSYSLIVRPDGTVEIPYAGIVSVSGLEVRGLEEKIKRILITRGYEPLRTGKTELSVRLTKIRTIQVHVVGAMEPGTYSVPSIASAMHVLYEAGGPGPYGSYRDIQIIRSGRLVGSLDIYDFIQTGNSGNITLENNDILRIPTYINRVNLSGEFKRPGLYELKDDESLQDLLVISGGFTEAAYQGNVVIFRVDSTELTIKDASKLEFQTFKLKSGDVVTASPVRNRFNNRVAITGGIVHPGYYMLNPGMTVSDLIARADGLDRKAFGGKGYVRRSTESGSGKYFEFNLSGSDLLLANDDSVYIPSSMDLQIYDSVHVRGFVHRPENFVHYEGLTMEQALLLAGGIRTDGDLTRIEVSFPEQIDGVFTGQSKIVEVTPNWQGLGTLLPPGATVSVRQRPYLNTSKVVFVVGAVRTPGGYSLTRDGEPLKDLLQRVGDFNDDALPNFGMVVRNLGFILEEEKKLETKKPQFSPYAIYEQEDTLTNGKVAAKKIRRADTIAVDLLSRTAQTQFRLQNGDTLFIPRRLNTVNIRGAVLNPGGMTFQSGKRALYYVRRTGGLSPNAVRRSLRVEYANGQSSGMRYALGLLPIYPRVYSNSTIRVEEKNLEAKKLDPAQLSAVGSILASISSVTLSIFYLLR